MRGRPPDRPTIRIEPPEPGPPAEESAPGPAGRARIAVAGVAGLALGFLLAVSLAPSDETPTTTVPDTDPVAAPDTTEEPTRDGADIPGELFVVTGSHGGELVVRRFDADGDTGSTARLPDGLLTTTLSWDAARSAIAALGPGPAGTALYAGPPEAVVPITLAAVSFAWHATDPGRVAWTEPGEASDVLVTGNILSDDLGRLEIGPVSGAVISWGSWGYLVQSFQGDTQVELIAESGTTVMPGSIAAINTNYRSVPIFTDAADGGPPQPAIIDPEAGTQVEIEPGTSAFLVLVSPAGRQAAWVVQTEASTAELFIQGFGDAAPRSIEVPRAQILDWSPDGSLFAMQATTSRVEDDSVFRPLLVVDAADGTVHEIPLERGDVLAAAVRTSP